MMKLLVVLLVMPLSAPVLGFPTGAGDGACVSLLPGHGNTAQPGNGGYSLSVSASTYSSTGSVTVTIRGPNLQGFLVQARSTDGSTFPVGTWEEPANSQSLQTKRCSSNADSVTHTNNGQKSNIVLTWNTPGEDVGPLKFYATVAREMMTWYTGIESDTLSFSDCGCAAVQVTGTAFDFADNLPGIYKIFNCQENGRAIYQSEDGRHFVYWNSGQAEWAIMRDGLGTGTVIYRNFAPIATQPWDVSNPWDLVIEEDGFRDYEATPEVSVTCMCHQAVCESYRFDTAIAGFLPAEFVYNADFNGRPWYQMTYLNQNLHLYFHRDANQGCAYWKVGAFNTNDAVLMAYDVAVNPYAIKAPWMLGNEASFSTIDDYTQGPPDDVSTFTCTRFRN